MTPKKAFRAYVQGTVKSTLILLYLEELALKCFLTAPRDGTGSCSTVPLLSDGAPGVSRFSSGDILFQGATRSRDDGLDQDHVKGANNLREIAPHAPYAQGTVKSTLFLLYLEVCP